MDSLNIIKNNIEEENNKINNKKSAFAKNDKKGQKRSKSEEEKNINGIIKQFYINDNSVFNRRERKQ